ncbi:MAG: transposase [Ktedonobacterales bacterium]
MATAFPHAQVELWAIDEHRIRLKPLLRRVWAPIGQRPTITVQQRFAWRHLVGFVHPASGRTLFHLATTVSIPVFDVELAEFARKVGAAPTKQIVLVLDRAGGTPACGCGCQTTSICSSCHRTPPNCSPPSTGWPMTNTALVNQHFASLEDLENAQFARCAALQQWPDRIRPTTCFHWWPKRVHKRRGPRRN